MERFLTATPPSASSSLLAPYITEEDKIHHHSVFGSDYSAPCTWYVRGISSLGVEEEKDSIKKGKIKETIGKETLMIATLNDPVSSADRAKAGMQAGVQSGKLAYVEVNSGHWVMLECATETNRVLAEFLEKGVDAFDKGKFKSSL